MQAYRDAETEQTRERFTFNESDLRSCRTLKPDASGKALLSVLKSLNRIQPISKGVFALNTDARC
jgi:hypothetical protein